MKKWSSNFWQLLFRDSSNSENILTSNRAKIFEISLTKNSSVDGFTQFILFRQQSAIWQKFKCTAVLSCHLYFIFTMNFIKHMTIFVAKSRCWCVQRFVACIEDIVAHYCQADFQAPVGKAWDRNIWLWEKNEKKRMTFKRKYFELFFYFW